MSKQHTRPFQVLFPLSTFTSNGHTYRKCGEGLTAIRDDETTGVFYPKDIVTIVGRAPRTLPLHMVREGATITRPSKDFAPVEYLASEVKLEEGVDFNELVHIND